VASSVSTIPVERARIPAAGAAVEEEATNLEEVGHHPVRREECLTPAVWT
jgi:hypothetical protein